MRLERSRAPCKCHPAKRGGGEGEPCSLGPKVQLTSILEQAHGREGAGSWHFNIIKRQGGRQRPLLYSWEVTICCFSLFNFFLFRLHVIIVCQEAHRPGRSEDNFWCLLLFFEARLFYVSLISFYLYVGLRSQTQVIGLGWQALLSSEPSHRPCWFSFII